MRTIFISPIFAAMLSTSAPSFAAASLPAEGSYGFDWHKNPNSVHCDPVSKALIKQFKKCDITDGSFGGDPVKAYQCTVSSKSEYLVYATKEACVKSLETEKSNE